jgi:plastocyanin
MRTRKSRWLWITILSLIMVAMLAACGGSGDDGNSNDSANNPADDLGGATEPAGDAGGSVTVEVKIVDNAFEPAEITVAPGTTVIWTNSGQVQHTVTVGERDNPTGMFDSGYLDPGGTFQYTFTEEGIFPYYCIPHPGMDATVIVASG